MIFRSMAFLAASFAGSVPPLLMATALATASPVPDAAPEIADGAEKQGPPLSAAYLERERKPVDPPGPMRAFLALLLWGYRNGISPADGPTCSFAPTCAGFAADALRRHGPAEGILMAGDRILRCNGFSTPHYPRVLPHGRFLDPVP